MTGGSLRITALALAALLASAAPIVITHRRALAAAEDRPAAPKDAAAEPDALREARRAFERGDLDAALALADKAVEARPTDVRCLAFRASLREGRRDWKGAVADYDRLLELQPEAAPVYQRRGAAHFRLGRFKESVADFDKYLSMNPREEPYHWQRGISHYYAGEYEKGRKQFESHRSVNPDDVENAVWHYLCVARASGVEAARAALIPVSGDRRVPMAQVHDLFAGKATPDDVLAAARAGDPPAEALNGRLFYAHLYVGLYHEARGDADKAREHITAAAEKHPVDHYMGDVARVHAILLAKDKK